MRTIDRNRTVARRLLAVARLLLSHSPALASEDLERYRKALLAAVEILTAAYVERHLETNGATPIEDADLDAFIDCLWAAVRDRLGARGAMHRVASRRNFRRGRGAETQLYRAYCKFRQRCPRRKGQARWREALHHGLLDHWELFRRPGAARLGWRPSHK